jgi:protein-S-isoprenylcysteine O-methyltransferase
MASTSAVNKSPPGPSADKRLTERNPWSVLQTGHNSDDSHHFTTLSPSPPCSPSPSDSKSLAGISLRAFLLGAAFGISFPLTILLLTLYESPLWRIPFFLLSLSLFHFLEYYTTALFNPTAASVSAFLLSQNGSAYNIAHTLAFLECALHSYLWPRGNHFYLLSLHYSGLVLGLSLILVGQTTRTRAMAHAGSNFNHLVQSRRKQGHVLVTDGIYAWLRHPSYFGFWWWGLGTQLVLGNVVCLVGYAVVLWRFFRGRIESELAPRVACFRC